MIESLHYWFEVLNILYIGKCILRNEWWNQFNINLLVIIFSLRTIPKFLHHLFYSLGNSIRTPLYWSCYTYLESDSHWLRKTIEHTAYLQSPIKFRKQGELNFSRYCQGNFLLERVSKYRIFLTVRYQFSAI